MDGLDPRLAAAFIAAAHRYRRVVLVRALIIAAEIALALYLDHWAVWIVVGLLGFAQLVVLVMLPFVARRAQRWRARLAADVTVLSWLHAAPDAKARAHRIELHDRADDVMELYATEAVAADAVAAARALAHQPTVTTTEAARTEVAMVHRLARKLRQLADAARAAPSAGLAAQAPLADRTVATWRARLFASADGASPLLPAATWPAQPHADLERQLDRLIHLYGADQLSRRKVSSIRELFTAEITAALAAFAALADRPPPA